jgi:hypothetical protein
MDHNAMYLLSEFRDMYYPIYSKDILETLMIEFLEYTGYTNPGYLYEMNEIFTVYLYEDYNNLKGLS